MERSEVQPKSFKGDDTAIVVRDAANELLCSPLSPAQRRIWAADRAQPGSAAYNIAFRWILDGTLDLAALQGAVNKIVQRHDILRARFASDASGPFQYFAASDFVTIDVADLRGLPAGEREATMDRICAEEAEKGFDVGKGPLIRVKIIQLTDDRSVLTLTFIWFSFRK